ncbi:LysR family transcriptional regulator [Deefgea tanakiae]|uniref:LysR family transcriptional regulator n=1 Tax=Deefgea tanakiae TaxID=2865840 RepID=A0ABX8Z216_9NEIS|nr:LysR family transcriptional regulator [Deefgea tanakiae]QZA76621.1 LysR family transcriptional regulator [Deefgea tanakiae]
MLNPLWLCSFQAVVRLGSFTRAADELNLTQAAISQHMARLEAQTGRLFIRQGRQLELTPNGQALLIYAQEVDIAQKRFFRTLSAYGPVNGSVSLMVPGSVGLKLYPELLAWQIEQPAISIEMRFAPEPCIIQALLDQTTELGIVTYTPSDERLNYTRLGQEQLCLVLPAQSQARGWDDLQQLGWINHPDGTAMAMRWFARAFPGKRLADIPERGFINQISLILQPVVLGLGFAILPQHAVKAFQQQDAIRIWSLEQAVSDTLWLVQRQEWPLSQQVRLAAEIIKSGLTN